jgi:hypothetical protein
MVQLAVVSLVCLIVAASCIAIAGIIALFAKIAASQGGAVGCFVLAAAILVALGMLILCAGFF